MSLSVRLVATDLDGTLLGDGGIVSERTRAAVAAVVASGVHVVAATGRSQWTAEPLVHPVTGIEEVVCSNGASLYHVRRRRSLAEYPIADAVIDEILVTLGAQLPGCTFGWETTDALHYEARFLALRPAIEREASPDLVAGPRSIPIRKLMVAHDHLQHYELLDTLTPLLPGGCLATTSGAPFVEITGDGVDKAFGVQRVCHRLGIGAEQVLAFGDNLNDLGLLRWAGRAVAMGNAHPQVRVAVGEVTGSHLDHGVAAVLETLL